MSSPALGIAFSFWLRLRWVIVGMPILLLVFALAIHLFPGIAPFFVGGTTLILLGVLVPMLNTFTFGPADLGVRSSGFPTHMMVLPLSNRSLVGWPMLFGAATHAVLWMLVATIVYRPAAVNMPVLWPATLLAAIGAWVQAVGWTPFPSPFARVPALAISLTPLIMVPACAGLVFEGPAHSIVIVACSLAWILVAYLYGVHGLSRARRGSDWNWLSRTAERWAARVQPQQAVGRFTRRPFRSPAAAQLWHECRRNAVALPVLLGFVGLPLALVLCLPILDNRADETLLFGSVHVTPSIMALAFWIILPLFLSKTLAAIMAKFDIWGKEEMSSFFATRPISTTQFVGVKLIAVSFSSLAAWTVVLVLFAFWAFVEASPLNARESLVRAQLAQASPRTIAIFFAILLGLVAMTWRNIVTGMWPTLMGRKQLAQIFATGFLVIYITVGLTGSWIYQHPHVHAEFYAVLPWLVATALALKFCAAVAVSFALRTCRLIPTTTINMLAVGWLLLAASIIGGTSVIVPPSWSLVATVFMLVPFASVAAAPLALHRNRHR